MNDLNLLKNNVYAATFYETTRKGKMYLKNDSMLRIGVEDLLDLLKGIDVTAVQLRFFYTRFTIDQSKDLLTNYPEKLLTAILLKTLVRNLPLTIRNVFTDHNTYVFDIYCRGDNTIIRETLKEIFRHEATTFVSRVEARTTGEDEELFFCLQGRYTIDYPHSILPQNDPYDVIAPIQRHIPVSLEIFDQYHRLLAEHYPIFYHDVKDRLCTIWCAVEGRGAYIIKRHVVGEKVTFASTWEDAESLFQIERIVQVVSNVLPETLEHPIEMVLDLDVPSDLPYEVVKRVSDRFAEWLIEQELLFHRRLTGSVKGGQHFILPICWTHPMILGGKKEVWEVYIRRTWRHILCDSVRDAAELLCLLFQIENPSLASFCSTHIFDPYARYKRILFDVGSNSMNRGRRALLSLHHNSLHVCVPLKTELPTTQEELLAQTSLDLLLDNPSSLTEPSTTKFMQEHNTEILWELVDRHEQLYHEFYTTTRWHFEETHCGIPINRFKIDTQENELTNHSSPI